MLIIFFFKYVYKIPLPYLLDRTVYPSHVKRTEGKKLIISGFSNQKMVIIL